MRTLCNARQMHLAWLVGCCLAPECLCAAVMLQRDEFHVHLPPLGALSELSIGPDGPRDWHLDKVSGSFMVSL
jgi:hypothetical protein